MTFSEFNNLDKEELKSCLFKCCGSDVWITKMVEKHPFRGENQLFNLAAERPGMQLTVDLESCTVSDGDSYSVTFDVEPSRRHNLLNGLDDIALTLRHEDKINAFEQTMPRF